MKPQTIAGLRAIVASLVETGGLEGKDKAAALEHVMLDAPALAREA